MARKLTEGRLNSLQLAQKFVSLPKAISRMDLLDAVEIAKVELGVTDSEFLYLRLAVRNTPDRSWRDGLEPIFAWPRLDIARTLGRSEKSVYRIEKSLTAKGLVVHRDGPLKRRFRSPDLKHAAGVSLAPMGARAAELLAIKDQAIEDQRAWRRARKEIYSHRAQLVEALEFGDFPNEIRAMLHDFLKTLPTRTCVSATIVSMRELLTKAKEILEQVMHMVKGTQMSLWEDANVSPSNNPDIESQNLCSQDREFVQKEDPEHRSPSAGQQRMANALSEEIALKATEAGIEISRVLDAAKVHGTANVISAVRAVRQKAMDLSASSPLRNPTGYFLHLVKIDQRSQRTGYFCGNVHSSAKPTSKVHHAQQWNT